jgi:hypothetical protein
MRLIHRRCYTVHEINTGETMAESRYEIRVQGQIGPRWHAWFDGMRITHEQGDEGSPVTILTGPVADQAALRGILSRLWDLNLTLLSVTLQSKGAGSNE